jgi:predicted permease
MFTLILYGILEIFALFILGGFAFKLGFIRNEDIPRWSTFLIKFLIPLLIFSSLVKNLQVDRIAEFWPLPLAGFGIMVLGALLSYPLILGLKSTVPDIRKTFVHCCTINNCMFLPLILVQNLWGEEALPLLFLFNLGSSVGVWTIGVGVLGGAVGWKERLKHLLSPSLISILLALLVLFSGLDTFIPALIIKVTANVGATSPPLMMMIIGATLYQNLNGFRQRDIWYMALVRLALLPVLTILILRAIPLSNEVYNLSAIVALMPVAAMSSILTQHYGGSPQFAARSIVLSTLLSMLSIPAMLWLFPLKAL